MRHGRGISLLIASLLIQRVIFGPLNALFQSLAPGSFLPLSYIPYKYQIYLSKSKPANISSLSQWYQDLFRLCLVCYTDYT